jgi:hypothetical protein
MVIRPAVGRLLSLGHSCGEPIAVGVCALFTFASIFTGFSPFWNLHLHLHVLLQELSPQWPWAKDWMGPPCDPLHHWMVYGGALYCNYQNDAASKFANGIDANIAAANARWVAYYGSLEAGPFNSGCLADCFSTTCDCESDCTPGWCG